MGAGDKPERCAAVRPRGATPPAQASRRPRQARRCARRPTGCSHPIAVAALGPIHHSFKSMESHEATAASAGRRLQPPDHCFGTAPTRRGRGSNSGVRSGVDPPFVQVHGITQITRNSQTSVPPHRRDAKGQRRLLGWRPSPLDRSTICSSPWNCVKRLTRAVGGGCSHPTPVSEPPRRGGSSATLAHRCGTAPPDRQGPGPSGHPVRAGLPEGSLGLAGVEHRRPPCHQGAGSAWARRRSSIASTSSTTASARGGPWIVVGSSAAAPCSGRCR